jgi:hypothetical protein
MKKARKAWALKVNELRIYGQKKKKAQNVTDLTIIGNAIPQHMNQNIPKKDKKRDPVFGGQEFATECSCFFPFSEVENMQFFWVK